MFLALSLDVCTANNIGFSPLGSRSCRAYFSAASRVRKQRVPSTKCGIIPLSPNLVEHIPKQPPSRATESSTPLKLGDLAKKSSGSQLPSELSGLGGGGFCKYGFRVSSQRPN